MKKVSLSNKPMNAKPFVLSALVTVHNANSFPAKLTRVLRMMFAAATAAPNGFHRE